MEIRILATAAVLLFVIISAIAIFAEHDSKAHKVSGGIILGIGITVGIIGLCDIIKGIWQ